jgi:hypothetical protein
MRYLELLAVTMQVYVLVVEISGRNVSRYLPIVKSNDP